MLPKRYKGCLYQELLRGFLDMKSFSDNPTVSIVLPTYNRANELKLSIQSILSQSYRDFELIVVDDASTDNTREVVAGFKDDRIRYVCCNENVGGGEARNIGIAEAKADIIAFQDSDDEWRCNKLEKCLSILQHDNTLDGVFSAFLLINGEHVSYAPVLTPPSRPELMHDNLLRGNFIDTPTVVVRSDIVKKVGGFDPLMPRYQDWELFLRLTEAGRFYFVKEALILSHCTPGSISSNIVEHKNALKLIYNKNKDLIDIDQDLMAFWLHLIGEAQILTKEVYEGRRNLIRATMLKPFNIRYLLKTLFAIPGSVPLYSKLKNIFSKNGRSAWSR
jgi:glycosyltransferase involved in cell wall biosynthesis